MQIIEVWLYSNGVGVLKFKKWDFEHKKRCPWNVYIPLGKALEFISFSQCTSLLSCSLYG